MTIDERLERLTERHEALTQTVELLTADVRTLAGNVEALTANVTALTADAHVQRRTMDDLMLGFSTLAELARRHEQRLDRIDDRIEGR